MALAINHNLMALSVGRHLGRAQGSLAASVRRLSSGLRVEQAADDAAGLAIRELMRSEISALNQGVRNANDAISMLQTHDGSLQIIDEKLIRLKELAEQAATGTYSSDQRLMIDSEFQAMKSEITRIALATDFNGIKLLCDDTANKLNIGGGGGGTPPAPPEIIGPPGDILNPDAVDKDAVITYTEVAGGEFARNSSSGDAKINGWDMGTAADIDPPIWLGILDGITLTFTYTHNAANKWTLDAASEAALRAAGMSWINPSLGDNGELEIAMQAHYAIETTTNIVIAKAPTAADRLTSNARVSVTFTNSSRVEITSGKGQYPDIAYMGNDLWDLDGDGSADIRTAFVPGGGTFGLKGGTSDAPGDDDYVTKIHFGSGNDSAEDYYYIRGYDCTAEGLGIGDVRVETQDNAQKALDSLYDALVLKDGVRAYFGAMQNRLENTISNLQIQAENLQTAESRISDIDVALEMTSFVRSQILAQAAVSMYAQANNLPRMAVQLLRSA